MNAIKLTGTKPDGTEVFKELEEINNEIFNRRSSSITG